MDQERNDFNAFLANLFAAPLNQAPAPAAVPAAPAPAQANVPPLAPAMPLAHQGKIPRVFFINYFPPILNPVQAQAPVQVPAEQQAHPRFTAFTAAEIDLIENCQEISAEEKEDCTCPISMTIMGFPVLSLDDNVIYDKSSVLNAVAANDNQPIRGKTGVLVKAENLHPVGLIFQKIHVLLDKAKAVAKRIEGQASHSSPKP